jgi:hypothetical protein
MRDSFLCLVEFAISGAQFVTGLMTILMTDIAIGDWAHISLRNGEGLQAALGRQHV